VRPIIGISSYAQEARWGPWSLPAAILPFAYVQSIADAGGRPILIPPSDDAVEETLDAIDGFVLSGGLDVDPSTYGAEQHVETTPIQPERDRAELGLLQGALARDMPVLAICRGMQILNVARGGDLDQHLPEKFGHEGHRETLGVFSTHEVRLDTSSRTGSLLGERAEVRSHHHQGLRSLGDGLTAVGWADDGCVEAIEDPNRPFAIGVLWHPEEGEDKTLFRALVEEAGDYRKKRRH
jgi:gamma-glutamyl-gamma-aminobutyrate hydrolase PuuD